MKIKDVMTPGVECVGPDETVQTAARKMKVHDIGAVPVCDGDRLTGMVTDRDIAVRCAAEGFDPATCRVREVMTPDIAFAFDDQTVEEAEEEMADRQVRRLPVLNRDKRLVGIVALGDLATRIDDSRQVGGVLRDVSQPTGSRY